MDQHIEKIEGSYDSTDRSPVSSKWTRLEALIGSSDRIKRIAKDIVHHFEARQEVFEGKAMIVAMSRRIAVQLYQEVIRLRPGWHSDALTKRTIKVVRSEERRVGRDQP